MSRPPAPLTMLLSRHTKRREFIAGVGGAALWSVMARAQQQAPPLIGHLHPSSAQTVRERLDAFHRGLAETGYVEGRNLAIEYRWAEGHIERLPELAANLLRRPISVLAATGGSPAALAAASATKTVPVVFAMGGDPVSLGLVTSLAHPGGNVTGVALLISELAPKRVEFLHAVAPDAKLIGLLTNPANRPTLEAESLEAQHATGVLGLGLTSVSASTPLEIEAAFAELSRRRIGALLVGGDSFFIAQRDQIASLAVRHGIPAIYQDRLNVVAGGLMSYGGSLAEGYRLAGIYAGRILKGQTPAELPVEQATRVELVLNLKAAEALGVTFPSTLLVRADEVIE